MKKIIVAAVATAFVAPAMASGVTVGGLMEFYYKDNNGAKSTGFGDNAVYVGASTELDNGMSVSADWNISLEGADVSSDGSKSGDTSVAADDGATKITIAGGFGKLELGDTSNAVDKFDDRNDKDVVIDTIGVSGDDAAIAYTLPTFVNGLTTYVSYNAANNDSGDGKEGTGIGFEYAVGPVEVAYAKFDADSAADENSYLGATVTLGALAVNFDYLTNDNASGTDLEVEQVIGASYTMGDTTFTIANQEDEGADGSSDADATFYGVKHSLGGGVTLFAEMGEDDVAGASSDNTAVGVAYSF